MSSTWNRFRALTTEQQERVLESCDEIDDSEMTRRYDDMLDECTEPFIGTYPASQCLRAVDPIAYRCGYADYCGSEPYIEIDGSYYDESQVDRAIDDVESEAESSDGGE